MTAKRRACETGAGALVGRAAQAASAAEDQRNARRRIGGHGSTSARAGQHDGLLPPAPKTVHKVGCAGYTKAVKEKLEEAAHGSGVDRLDPAERRVVEAVAAARKEDPQTTLDSFSQLDKPAIVDGRLARLRLLTAPGELDLRGLGGLVEVAVVWSAELASLVLGEHPRLRSLVLNRCRLTTLDVGGCTALETLEVEQNRLTELIGLPATLRKLSCGRNPLGALDVRGLAGLEELMAFQCGLSAIDLSNLHRLRNLALHDNALTEIDARALARAESLYLDGNRGRVLLPDAPGLTHLSADDALLTSFDAAPYPRLQILSLQRCGLSSLDLDNASLESLAVTGNRLTDLDLRATPRLRQLRAADNPLARVDLSDLGRLTTATLPPSAEVTCTELQLSLLPELRARLGLAKPATAITKMDAFQLHRFVQEYDWDDGAKKLFEVIRNPQCDRATALLVYWQSQPEEFAAYPTPADAPPTERKWVELLREIEAKVAASGFATARVGFDVHDVDGVDLSDTDPRIPAAMREPVRPPAGPRVVVPPSVDGAGKAAAAKAKPAKKAAPKKRPPAKN